MKRLSDDALSEGIANGLGKLGRAYSSEDVTTIFNAIREAEREKGESSEVLTDLTWKHVAMMLGENFGRTGPPDYYSMTPQHWLEWISFEIDAKPPTPYADKVLEVAGPIAAGMKASESEGVPYGDEFVVEKSITLAQALITAANDAAMKREEKTT